MIKSVHVFVNGMCVVFDEAGQQMSQYQGPWNEKKSQILADAPPSATFNLSQWREWSQPIGPNVAERISINIAVDSESGEGEKV